eukprot:4742495-Ditylum_brightwellii.AAC.1
MRQDKTMRQYNENDTRQDHETIQHNENDTRQDHETIQCNENDMSCALFSSSLLVVFISSLPCFNASIIAPLRVTAMMERFILFLHPRVT